MSATTAAAAIRTAFLGRDFAPLEDRLADDVVFRSPVLAQPWTTRPVLAELGPAMVSIFDEVGFDRVTIDGSHAILAFHGRLGTVEAEAIKTIEVDEAGRIAEMAIYIRPLPALIAVAKAMGARVDPELIAGHVR